MAKTATIFQFSAFFTVLHTLLLGLVTNKNTKICEIDGDRIQEIIDRENKGDFIDELIKFINNSGRVQRPTVKLRSAKVLTIADYQEAAKIIEQDGTSGIETAAKIVGWDIAMALLISSLRIQCGSTTSFPAPEDLENKVNKILDEENLGLQ